MKSNNFHIMLLLKIYIRLFSVEEHEGQAVEITSLLITQSTHLHSALQGFFFLRSYSLFNLVGNCQYRP